jgi:hypothetical protein
MIQQFQETNSEVEYFLAKTDLIIIIVFTLRKTLDISAVIFL